MVPAPQSLLLELGCAISCSDESEISSLFCFFIIGTSFNTMSLSLLGIILVLETFGLTGF